jgi:hypothetical protein
MLAMVLAGVEAFGFGFGPAQGPVDLTAVHTEADTLATTVARGQALTSGNGIAVAAAVTTTSVTPTHGSGYASLVGAGVSLDYGSGAYQRTNVAVVSTGLAITTSGLFGRASFGNEGTYAGQGLILDDAGAADGSVNYAIYSANKVSLLYNTSGGNWLEVYDGTNYLCRVAGASMILGQSGASQNSSLQIHGVGTNDGPALAMTNVSNTGRGAWTYQRTAGGATDILGAARWQFANVGAGFQGDFTLWIDSDATLNDAETTTLERYRFQVARLNMSGGSIGFGSVSAPDVALVRGASGALHVTDGSATADVPDTTADGLLVANRIQSIVATGTAPLTVASTTVVTNLNADALDGQSGTFYQDGITVGFGPATGVGSIGTTTTAAFTTIATSGAPALAFDGGTMESIEWTCTLPANYRSGNNLTVEIVVSSASASQATEWDVRFGTLEAADLDSTAPGALLDTAVAATGTTSSTAGTATTIVWTLSNAQIDDAAAGDLLLIQLYRDAGAAGDTSAVDVFVHQLRFFQ